MKKRNELLEEYESDDEAYVPKLKEETIEEVHSTIDWSEFGQEFEEPGLKDEEPEEEVKEEVVEVVEEEDDDDGIIRAEDIKKQTQPEEPVQVEAKKDNKEETKAPSKKKSSPKKDEGKETKTPSKKKTPAKKVEEGEEKKPSTKKKEEVKDKEVKKEEEKEEAKTPAKKVEGEEKKPSTKKKTESKKKEDNKVEEAKPVEVKTEETPAQENKIEEVKPVEEAPKEAPVQENKPEEIPAPVEEKKVEETKPVEAPSEPVQETKVEEEVKAEEVPAPVQETKEEEKVEPKETPAPVQEVKVEEEVKAEEAPAPIQETKVEPTQPVVITPVRPANRQAKVFTVNKPKVQMVALPKNKLKKELVDKAEIEEVERLVKEAKEKGFGYLYSPSFDVDHNLAFVQVVQTLEIDNEKRMVEEVFHPVIEKNGEIFEVNKIAIQKVLEEAKKKVDVKFVVQVSHKFLESDEKYKELEELLFRAPINIILCFDARSLKNSDEASVKRLYDLLNATNLRMMLDNVEEERLSMLFEFPLYYLRIDADYYQDKSVAQSSVLSMYSTFSKSAKIHLTVKNVNTEDQIKYFSKYGAKRFEGEAIIPDKLSLQDIYNALRKKMNA